MATTAVSYHGANAAIGFGEEVTYGTAVSRTNWRYIIGCSFQHRMNLATREHTRTSATSFNDRGSFFKTRMFWDGRLSLEANFDALGMLWNHAVGNVSTQNDTPSSGYYTHTYVRAFAFPVGLTFELNRGGESGGSKELFAGGKIRAWEIEGETGSYLRAHFDCQGSWATSETAPRDNTPASPSFGSDDNLITADYGTTIAWNSTTAKVKRFRLRVENGLMDNRQFVGSLTNDQLIRQTRELITYEADVEVNDVKWAEYVSQAQGDLVQSFSLGTRKLEITVQNAQIMTISDPLPDREMGVLNSTITWKGFTDGTDDGIKLVTVNQESSATGNG